MTPPRPTPHPTYGGRRTSEGDAYLVRCSTSCTSTCAPPSPSSASPRDQSLAALCDDKTAPLFNRSTVANTSRYQAHNPTDSPSLPPLPPSRSPSRSLQVPVGEASAWCSSSRSGEAGGDGHAKEAALNLEKQDSCGLQYRREGAHGGMPLDATHRHPTALLPQPPAHLRGYSLSPQHNGYMGLVLRV